MHASVLINVFSAHLIFNLIVFIITDANLSLFGSSCNGFGFRLSDLDITLTFHGRKTDEVLCTVIYC